MRDANTRALRTPETSKQGLEHRAKVTTHVHRVSLASALNS